METPEQEQTDSKQAWEERYQQHAHVWSGNPNPALVAEVSGLAPGTALDAGAGEGADACWLAVQGWRVTGLDLSSTAIERAQAHAAERGLDVTFRQADLIREPIAGSYDLVTSHYLHLPPAERDAVFRRLADAVAPEGRLLIVGHDPSDAQTTVPRPELGERGWTVAELVAWLGDGWDVEVAESRPRQVTDPEGRDVTIHDVVVRARRV